jgi:hypothetical protein
MSHELDPALIADIDSIELPRLTMLFHIEGGDKRDMPFSISFPEDITVNMVEHVYLNRKTGERSVLLRRTEAEELLDPLPNEV